MRDPTPAKVVDMIELMLRDRVRNTQRIKVGPGVELLAVHINGRTFTITVEEIDSK